MGRKSSANAGFERPRPLVPTQNRSRERFERILACAVDLMAEKGPDALRMSDIAARTGIVFGSLYQYFPDKTAVIATLAERHNAIGHDCVRKELSALRRIGDLHAVLSGITDGYYRFFLDEPAVRHIWQATQGDRALKKLDEEDGIFLAELLTVALQDVAPGRQKRSLSLFSQTIIVLIAAAVRQAIALPPREAGKMLALFKRMLPKDLAALDV